jgi:hypothetical protein
MNLQEYFNKKKESKISSIDKLEIYQKFISKRNSKSFESKKRFFVVKSFAYTTILLFLFI